MKPDFHLGDPDTDLYVGDCVSIMEKMSKETADLVVSDPPFGIGVTYAFPRSKDDRKGNEYYNWVCWWIQYATVLLKPNGCIWVNAPDEWQAEICLLLKRLGLTLVNHCIWHFRFGQHTDSKFITSKTHALYFAKDAVSRTWNPDAVLEPSDRASVYADARTQDTARPGMRVPLDVWYGPYWGRVQGNNKERSPAHQNQLPEVYLERIIRACSNPGDLILDPFLGSGTAQVVARALGRRSVGIEIDRGLAEAAFARISRGAIRVR